MTRAFADYIQLPLEIVALQSISRSDEELHNARLRRARCRTDIRLLRADRHFAPAQALLPLLCDDRLYGLHAVFALGLNRGQKNQTGAEPAFCRQLHTQIFLSHFTQKVLRQSDQNTGAIPGVRLATTTTAVLHIHQHLQCIEHILMARQTLQISHKPNAAAVLLVSRVIQTLLLRQSKLSFTTHFNKIQSSKAVYDIRPAKSGGGEYMNANRLGNLRIDPYFNYY